MDNDKDPFISKRKSQKDLTLTKWINIIYPHVRFIIRYFFLLYDSFYFEGWRRKDILQNGCPWSQ